MPGWSRDLAKRLAQDGAWGALWEPGSPVFDEIEGLKRQLLDDSDRGLEELNRLRSKLAGIEFVRRAVERSLAPEEQVQIQFPATRAKRPAFISRFLPRALGG